MFSKKISKNILRNLKNTLNNTPPRLDGVTACFNAFTA